jgi:hypothetical protein
MGTWLSDNQVLLFLLFPSDDFFVWFNILFKMRQNTLQATINLLAQFLSVSFSPPVFRIFKCKQVSLPPKLSGWFLSQARLLEICMIVSVVADKHQEKEELQLFFMPAVQ